MTIEPEEEKINTVTQNGTESDNESETTHIEEESSISEETELNSPQTSNLSSRRPITSAETEAEVELFSRIPTLNSDEASLEKEFIQSLKSFGIDSKYIEKFQNADGWDKGWDINKVDEETVEKEQKEASLFARCIELEEQLESITIPHIKKQYEEEIENLQFELELLKKERNKL
jgi:hypothetical protein